VTMTIQQLFETLDRFESAVPIDTLVDLMTRAELSLDELSAFVRFDPDHYCRNLVSVSPAYAALVLCWSPGQASPIHDHRGSACGVRVLKGTASEIKYRRETDGNLTETERAAYPLGNVCGSYDADIHVMYNDQPAGGEGLVTLHIYTPPLRDVRTYSLESTEVGTWTDTVTIEAQKRLGITPVRHAVGS
jgi:cysteine dioxygenase